MSLLHGTGAQISPATALAGAWHLVRWDISYSDGRPTTLPYGDQACGTILYTDDGWMSACIARGDRPKLSSASVRSAPESERLAAFESYFQYSGPYTLQTVDGQLQVAHRVTMALNPNFVGTEQVRNATFSGDDGLTLSASDTVPGGHVARHHRLIWSRRKPQP